MLHISRYGKFQTKNRFFSSIKQNFYLFLILWVSGPGKQSKKRVQKSTFGTGFLDFVLKYLVLSFFVVVVFFNFGELKSFMWDHWCTSFGLLVRSSLGFKARLGSLIRAWDSPQLRSKFIVFFPFVSHRCGLEYDHTALCRDSHTAALYNRFTGGKFHRRSINKAVSLKSEEQLSAASFWKETKSTVLFIRWEKLE